MLGSLLAVGASAQPNLLTAGDFEGISSLSTYSPTVTGVWGTESSVLSGAGNGITPLGRQMLLLTHAGGGSAAQTNQIIKGPFKAGSVVTFSVKFNTWLAASSKTPQTVAVIVQTDAGIPLTGTRYTSPTVALDTDTSTWQTATVKTTLTADTEYLSAEIVLWMYSGALPFGTPLAYADDAVLTVVPPAELFFTDSLTGPTSDNLAAFPVGKYSYTATGLLRSQSNNDTDRPVVGTALSSYLAPTTGNFAAELTINEVNNDLLYFGLGQGDNDPNYNNEPAHAFYFRVHNNFVNGGPGYYGIQADVRGGGGFLQTAEVGNYLPGSTITLRITRIGDQITLSMVGGGSVSYSLSAYQAALGLTDSNTRVFFGNTTVGSHFSDLAIYPLPSDSTPPVITAPEDILAEATGPAGAVVTFAATAVDDVDGPVPVEAMPESGSTFPLGVTTVDLGASDAAGNTAFKTFKVTVQDTTPPVISAPAALTAEATSAAGAVVTFTATASDLVSGPVPVTASPTSGSTFPVGTTTVALSATDGAGNTAHGSIAITVQDTTPPVIASVKPSTAVLWPPNHQMVPVTVSVVATDNTGVTSLKIVSVTSSEPDNGLGDGDTPNDTSITGPLTVNLRAERSGKGNGRTYTITVEATDAYGNSTTSTCTVSVPKSKGK